MRIGTKSLLFGVHNIFWHPFTVLLAWCKLYGPPNLPELVCIFVHDLGYWGCRDMDGPDGELHPFFGAELVNILFGEKYFELCLYHSRTLAKRQNHEPSKLCHADKLSMIYDPWFLYGPRAWLTGELKEYVENAKARGFIKPWEGSRLWHRKLVAHLKGKAIAEAERYARD